MRIRLIGDPHWVMLRKGGIHVQKISTGLGVGSNNGMMRRRMLLLHQSICSSDQRLLAWSANRSGCLVIGMVRDGKELYVRETREARVVCLRLGRYFEIEWRRVMGEGLGGWLLDQLDLSNNGAGGNRITVEAGSRL